MQAQKLKKKKNAISKGKIKKTIKNVICRPDPVFWPIVTESEANDLQTVLKEYCVPKPEFKKPHWNDLKLIPKKERLRQPHVQRVEGLLFGISECSNAVQTQDCIAVLIEANVNPQSIVQPVIEACNSSNISVLCLKDLRQLSLTNFGIKTSCLGVQKDCLPELSNKIQEIYQNHKPVKLESVALPCSKDDSLVDNTKKEDPPMDVDAYSPYVYRTDKKSRTFMPTSNEQDSTINRQFKGQHFIKISQQTKPESESKSYMRMILKKISNNPNRVKVKEKS